MSAVYRARDTLMSRTVVVKILKETNLEESVSQRFLLEAQIAGNLNHENVIRTYDFGFDSSDRPFMVLEYLEGEDLSEAIKAHTAGSLADRAQIGVELVAALDYIHSRNVIHRDLKPANIFLSRGNSRRRQVKLMDFGIARVKNVSITQAGMAIGTPSYMAPEQIRGEQVTKAVDIYALGVVLWELFTEERAFAADTLERVFYMALNESINLAKLRTAGVPDNLVRLIGECASKDVRARPDQLDSIGFALSQLASPQSEVATLVNTRLMQSPLPAAADSVVPAKPAVQPGKRNLWLAAAAGVLALLGIVSTVVVMNSGKRSEPQQKIAEAPIALPPTLQNGSMVLVPSGAFLFGKSKQSVDLQAFYVDRTEVSNREFAKFISATGARPPEAFAKANPDMPVVNVSFEEAKQFAAWAGKQIPNSQQWEKAARGVDGRTFPWGEAPETSRANIGKGASGSIVAVDSFPTGASPFEALQMVGNVWEWVDEASTPSPELLATFRKLIGPQLSARDQWLRIRGKSYIEGLDGNELWDSSPAPAQLRSPIVGFRCVRPAQSK